MPKGYTTRLKLENYLLTTIAASFYTQIDEWIEEVEEYIDQETGRIFVADSVASARYFDGDNSQTLLIDDAVAITEVKIGDTVMAKDTDPLLADGDYLLYPANKLPISKVVLRGSVFPGWPLRNVKITGKWGYSAAAPGPISNSATILLAGMVNFSRSNKNNIQSMSFGRYTVTYKTEKQWQDFDNVDRILKSYKKFSF